MSKFTKGKWELDVNQDSVFAIDEETGARVYIVPIIKGIHEGEYKANARLIADTPKMYKTLLEVKNFLEENDNEDMLCYLGIYELLARIDGKEEQE